jgi:hypothetical protein
MQFTYRITDLLTGEVTEDIALDQTSCSNTLSAQGDISTQFNVHDLRNQGKDLNGATKPGRTLLYVMYDDQPLWGGVIWNRVYYSESGVVQLTGNTFESLFYRFLIMGMTGGEFNWTTKSNAYIVSALLAWLQGDTYRNIGLLFQDLSTVTPAPTRDYSVHDYDMKSFGAVLEDLGQDEANGFDWNVRLGLNSSNDIVRTLVMGAPTLGIAAADTTLTWELWQEAQNNIRGLSWTENGSNAAVELRGGDSAEGYGKTFSTVTNTAYLTAGWPRLQSADTFTLSIDDAATLDDKVLARAKTLVPPKTSPSFRVNGNAEPVLGTYLPGDYALFSVRDPFIGDVDQTYRIRQISAQSGTTDVYLALVGDDNA